MFARLSFMLLALLAFSVGQVAAHSMVKPPLGVAGAPIRADTQRPNNRRPCGRMDIASNIDSTEPIPVAADGTFSAEIENFNRFIDGSRSVRGVVDPTGTGEGFGPRVNMLQNGALNPFQLGTEQITGSIPQGMQCTGGASGNLCLVRFTNTVGFGNCVVLQQGAGAAAAGNNPGPQLQADSNESGDGGNFGVNGGGNRAQGGTRAAGFALFNKKDARKRGVRDWVWA